MSNAGNLGNPEAGGGAQQGPASGNHEENAPNGPSGSTADFELWVQENKGILATLDQEGLVEFKINTRGSGVRGTDLFNRMMQHFGSHAKGVWGKWVSGTNLETVNHLTAQGLSLEEAVAKAWTANRARAFGFSRATVVKAEGRSGAYTSVEVKFTRS